MNTHIEEHDDDQPIGRVLSRREVLALLGGAGATLIVGTGFTRLNISQQAGTATPVATSVPSCVVRPELTEGPYFVDEQLNRSDIRVEPSDGSIVDGIPLYLKFRVSNVSANACMPLAGAQVDIWHCDADGEYSGVQDQGFDNADEMWLRGYQVTDEDGIAEFLTIVPGWYSGRAVHIHFKIRTTGTDEQSYEFTSQLFFDPELIEEIYAEEPYVDKGLPDTSNETDSIYQQSEDLLTLELVEMEAEEIEALREKIEVSELEAGYTAIFNIGLDLSDTEVSTSDSASGGNGGFPGGTRPGG